MRDEYSNDVEAAAYLAAEAEPADYDRPSPAEYAEDESIPVNPPTPPSGCRAEAGQSCCFRDPCVRRAER